MPGSTPKYASVFNPTVGAAVDALYRFANSQQALAKLAELEESFTVSRHFPKPHPEAIVLWIKGYGLTEEEKTQGYTGHYAAIAIQPLESGKFTLAATKLTAPLSQHPQKKRANKRHPDWGHPILRGIKKGKRYVALEEAQAELEQLHEQFPEISIPTKNGLYIMIYSRQTIEQSPVRKYKLEIGPVADGSFIIVCKENEKKLPPAKTPPKKPTEGYFSAMVQVKAKKKRPTKRDDKQ